MASGTYYWSKRGYFWGSVLWLTNLRFCFLQQLCLLLRLSGGFLNQVHRVEVKNHMLLFLQDFP